MLPGVIEQQKRELIATFGGWTAHNIALGHDLYTMGPGIAGDEIKLRRVIQIIADIGGKAFETLRVLDLACLEGLYAIELARRGATVTAIEGRAPNLAKVQFVKDVLSLDTLQLIQDDVRHLGKAAHGEFDVVLCLGILYHLDAPDVFQFLGRVAEVCRGIAIFDTHISLQPEVSHEFHGKTYWGLTYTEHAAGSTPEERASKLWASLDNPTSFWFTRPSLYNALSSAGFTTVFETHVPPEPQRPSDRVTLVAVKGRRAHLHCAP
ncbi:MAG TPA: methyltransferase domain-containing protein, partial [Planctomycetaceae bacterium]